MKKKVTKNSVFFKKKLHMLLDNIVEDIKNQVVALKTDEHGSQGTEFQLHLQAATQGEQ